jgi:hypothetical protein
MDPSLIHHDPLDVQMLDFSGLATFWDDVSPTDKSKIRENYSLHSGQVFSENLTNYSIAWKLE